MKRTQSLWRRPYQIIRRGMPQPCSCARRLITRRPDLRKGRDGIIADRCTADRECAAIRDPCCRLANRLSSHASPRQAGPRPPGNRRVSKSPHQGYRDTQSPALWQLRHVMRARSLERCGLVPTRTWSDMAGTTHAESAEWAGTAGGYHWSRESVENAGAPTARPGLRRDPARHTVQVSRRARHRA